MSDFLSREADILGSEFSTSMHRPTGSDDIDFDRAASAFPDIDIDSGDFIQSSQPAPPIVAARTSNGFSFDNFGSPPPPQKTEVKVTGDDDFDTFESEFPEIEISAGQVSIHSFFLELGCTPPAIVACYFGFTTLLHYGFCKHKMITLLTRIIQHRSQPQQPPVYGDTFAPQPHPSTFSSTPILTQNISEDEPQVIKCV